MRYELRVAVFDEGSVTPLRNDERIVANNAKPDEEWAWMVEQAGKTILHHATSQTPHHPFVGEYRVLISRATVEEESLGDVIERINAQA